MQFQQYHWKCIGLLAVMIRMRYFHENQASYKLQKGPGCQKVVFLLEIGAISTVLTIRSALVYLLLLHNYAVSMKTRICINSSIEPDNVKNLFFYSRSMQF